MENFYEYIKPELLILIPVLYFIGVAIKKSNIADRLIPWILGGASIVLCGVWVFANCECGTPRDILTAVFTAFTQGVLIAGTSVYINQLKKQTTENDTEKDGENDGTI